MGWRGALRSMAAASRAAARENERRAKYNARAQRASEAASAVADWEDLIEKLTTVNDVIDEAMDWRKTATQPEPVKPILEAGHQKRAQEKLSAFASSFMDFFFGGSERRVRKLEQALSAAIALDREEFDTATRVYDKAFADWQLEVALARRVLALDPTGFKEVVAEAVEAFKENLFGKSIEFQFGDTFLHVMPTVFPVTVVPKYRRKQLASGRLSETEMPAAQYYQIYQDYVAAIALGVANSMLKLLPVAEVYVTCKTEMLNTMTGHLEVLPILSGKFVRDTMAGLNLTAIDASDALANFNHVMSFKRAVGFSPVAPLTDKFLAKG
jgi:hypothetical protein